MTPSELRDWTADCGIARFRQEWDEQHGFRIFVDATWPAKVQISKRLVEEADPARFSRRDDRVTFTVENGRAEYRIVHEDDDALFAEVVDVSEVAA